MQATGDTVAVWMWTWILWSLLSGASLWLYGMTLWKVQSSSAVTRSRKRWAWLPPMALWVAWRSGLRLWPALTVVAVLLYGVSQWVEWLQ